MAAAILFIGNYGTGNVLEGFSFAMVIGVLTGTYSTVFVATPLLVWFEERSQRGAGSKGQAKASRADRRIPAIQPAHPWSLASNGVSR
jgi:preprotein translocase subunit SecF